MNEHEIRDALRGVMVASSPPPPMDTEAAVQTARRAHRRRHTMLAGAGTALAVTAIAVTTVVVIPDRSVVGPAASPPAAERPQSSNPSTRLTPPSGTELVAPPAPTETSEPAKPTDMNPRAADPNPTAGPRYERALQLHQALKAALPRGYTVAPYTPMSKYRAQDASFVERVNGVEVWMYQASVLPAQGDRTGVLHGFVMTPGREISPEPCTMFLRPDVPCQVIDVGGKLVGVSGAGPNDEVTAQYVYPDGTVVSISQSTRRTGDPDTPDPQPLEALPFTTQQLAALAVDPRFHLT